MHPTVEVRQLSFCHINGKNVLEQVAFSLHAGFCVILGSNGAGKSTLMELIAGERRPPTGAVYVRGEDVATRSSWRRSVGWVPQRNVFDPGQRAAQFVADVGWLRGMSHRAARSAAADALEAVGLTQQADQRLSTLSGGMQRRVMMAAGIVHDPSVLLLDEPTAGLDPTHRAFITDLLRERAAAGTTVLMSTHIAADVEDADRALVLDRGHISADAEVADLVKRYGTVEAAFHATTGGGGDVP